MNKTLTFYICIFDNKLHVCPHFYWRSTMLLLPVRHWALFSLYFFLSFFCFLTFFHGFAHTISNNPTRQPSSLNLWPVCFAWLGPWHALHPHTHKKKGSSLLSITFPGCRPVAALFIEGVPAFHPHHCHLLAVCSLQHVFLFLFSLGHWIGVKHQWIRSKTGYWLYFHIHPNDHMNTFEFFAVGLKLHLIYD